MGNETKYTLDNIHEFFDKLDNAPNPNIRKMMVWAGYERDKRLGNELLEISKLYKHTDDCPTHQYNVNKITDSIYVVEYRAKGETVGYLPCVKITDDYIKRPNILYKSFDECVIAAYSILYTGHEDAGQWACKLMDIGVGEE